MYGFRKLFDARHSYITKKELNDMIVGYTITKNKINSTITVYGFKLDLIIRKYEDVVLNLSSRDMFNRTIEMYLKDINRIERVAMIDEDSCLIKYKKKKLDAGLTYYYLTRGVTIPDRQQIEKYTDIIDKMKDLKDWQKLT